MSRTPNNPYVAISFEGIAERLGIARQVAEEHYHKAIRKLERAGALAGFAALVVESRDPESPLLRRASSCRSLECNPEGWTNE